MCVPGCGELGRSVSPQVPVGRLELEERDVSVNLVHLEVFSFHHVVQVLQQVHDGDEPRLTCSETSRVRTARPAARRQGSEQHVLQ